MILGELIMLLVILTGFVMYAFYAGCDPLTSGRIQQADQVHVLAHPPFFILRKHYSTQTRYRRGYNFVTDFASWTKKVMMFNET